VKVGEEDGLDGQASKSFRGLMAYKTEVMGIEGFLAAIVLLALPFVILAVLIRVLPTKRLSQRL
jgi:hypothetical protein